ncbi:dual specificity protein phosphatase 9 isoform X1 [Camelus bactrianus]|uniref:Dual specificity protein phosphatase 9 isoform X1 n=3 Tax=Camelus bactrianus TaxID=9837 RepID=A0AC58PZ25_CAMBA
MEGLGRSCLWLRRELSPPRPRLLLLDCRSRELYESARIGGALSVALPALLLRRLRRGSLSVRALLPGPPLQPPPPAPVLLYDQGGGRHRRGEAEAEAEEWEAESVLGTLLQKLREEGYLAYYLQGGFSRFQAECPHLCETSLSSHGGPSMAPVPSPVVGLGSLYLGSDCSDGESEPDRDSMSCGLDSEGATPPPAGLLPSFPVQILPNLYLGSARDSANVESLAKLGIRYILNVTPNLPNLFEKNGDFHYKQIPISDHWSQNLSQFFPEAIAFIEAPPLAQRCLRPGQEKEVQHLAQLQLHGAAAGLRAQPAAGGEARPGAGQRRAGVCHLRPALLLHHPDQRRRLRAGRHIGTRATPQWVLPITHVLGRRREGDHPKRRGWGGWDGGGGALNTSCGGCESRWDLGAPPGWRGKKPVLPTQNIHGESY